MKAKVGALLQAAHEHKKINYACRLQGQSKLQKMTINSSSGPGAA